MKSLKNIALSFLLSIGAFTAVTYTACNKDSSNPDPCVGIVCQNGGTCSNGICTCPSGYEGTYCETLTQAKYLGSWAASESYGTSGGTLAYTATIVAGTGSNLSIVIGNFSDLGLNVTASISGNTITIPNQAFATGYTVSGSGTYTAGTPNTISINYTTVKTSNNATVNYSGTWTK